MSGMGRAAQAPVGIAYFSDAPYIGGAEKYLLLLASRIERSAFEPALILNRNPRLEPLAVSAAEAGVAVHEVSLRLPSFRGVRHCVALLRRLRPAILHCNLPGPLDSQMSLIAPLARAAGVPHVVTTEHLPMVASPLKGRLVRRFASRSVDRVITVSRDNADHLERGYGVPARKIRVVYIGVPDWRGGAAEIRRQLGVAPGAHLAAMVGALEERKGHRTAFRAVARIGERAHLVVVGSGEMEGSYRSEVASLGIGARVHFLGYRADVDSILRGVDSLLLPSEIDATPYVAVEAMAAGIPVVASRIYGIPELVEDGVTGSLVPPGSVDACARALEALIDDPGRCKRMGEKGRLRYEERFTIERSVSETAAVYRELLEGSPARRAS